jgi:hypothetical protein
MPTLIGDFDPAVEALAVALLLAVELLLVVLLLLLHAARTPTESAATAPSVTAFLENQGRLALTPGSSFLFAQDSSENLRNRPRGNSACSPLGVYRRIP